VVTLDGSIAFGEGSNSARESEETDRRRENFVPDMENPDYIHSSNLGDIGRRTFECELPAT
jgi:hypothetical protein